jgi:hypothetical protein
VSRLTRVMSSERVRRDTAKAVLSRRVEQLRCDLEARSIGGRIVDKVAGDVSETAAEAADIVRSNKPVVAGTVLALTAWLFRNPIIALVEKVKDWWVRRKNKR